MNIISQHKMCDALLNVSNAWISYLLMYGISRYFCSLYFVLFYRPFRMHEMRPIATDVAQFLRSVCLWVVHMDVLYKNGWTDCEPMADLCGSKEPCN